MTFGEYCDSLIPEYYPTMYKDGYTPTQILYASRKKFRREYAERLARETEIDGIKITSEVKVR